MDETPKSLKLAATGNVITFVYTPNDDISYTVEYELADGTKLVDDKVVENQTMATTVSEDAESIAGYTVDETPKSLKLAATGNVITFVYTPNDDISYTVEYELADGTKLVDDKVVENQTMATTVSEGRGKHRGLHRG